MSRSALLEFHPIAIVQDRYQGVYCNGEWIAVANALRRQGDMTRINWISQCGPSGDDLCAGQFWADPPDWVASAATPDEAVKALLRKSSVSRAATPS